MCRWHSAPTKIAASRAFSDLITLSIVFALIVFSCIFYYAYMDANCTDHMCVVIHIKGFFRCGYLIFQYIYGIHNL